VNYKTITDEFINGTGPERSFFEGDHLANKEIQKHYLFRKSITLFDLSGKNKSDKSQLISWGLTDVIRTSKGNMQAQMMGSYRASYYKLGDRTLSLLYDTKNRYSLYYHIPGIQNYSRSEGIPVFNSMGIEFGRSKGQTTTHQTYLFFD